MCKDPFKQQWKYGIFQRNPRVAEWYQLWNELPLNIRIWCRKPLVENAILLRSLTAYRLLYWLWVEMFVDQAAASKHICAHQYFKPNWKTFATLNVFFCRAGKCCTMAVAVAAFFWKCTIFSHLKRSEEQHSRLLSTSDQLWQSLVWCHDASRLPRVRWHVSSVASRTNRRPCTVANQLKSDWLKTFSFQHFLWASIRMTLHDAANVLNVKAKRK